MKKLVFNSLAIAALGLFFSSCHQEIFCKHGGDIITQEITTDKEFTKVKLSGTADVYITKGDTTKITVIGEDGIIENLNTSVYNDEWKIYTKKHWCNEDELKVYITLPSLTSVEISGSGDITCTNGFTEDDFNAVIGGSGNLSAEITSSTLNAKISGSGNLDLTGSATTSTLKISGSGNLNAQSLSSDNVVANIPGSGSIYIEANQTLNADISGSGNIYYTGAASVTTDISGSGNVIAN